MQTNLAASVMAVLILILMGVTPAESAPIIGTNVRYEPSAFQTQPVNLMSSQWMSNDSVTLFYLASCAIGVNCGAVPVNLNSPGSYAGAPLLGPETALSTSIPSGVLNFFYLFARGEPGPFAGIRTWNGVSVGFTDSRLVGIATSTTTIMNLLNFLAPSMGANDTFYDTPYTSDLGLESEFDQLTWNAHGVVADLRTQFDYLGLYGSNRDTAILVTLSDVPEPGSWVLAAVGVVLIAAGRLKLLKASR